MKNEKNVLSAAHKVPSSKPEPARPTRKEEKPLQPTLAYEKEQLQHVKYRPSYRVKNEDPTDFFSENGQLQGHHPHRIEDDDEHSKDEIFEILNQLKTASKKKMVKIIMSIPQVDCPLAEALFKQESKGFTQERKDLIVLLFSQADLRREKSKQEREKKRLVLNERESFFNRRFLIFLSLTAVSEAVGLAFVQPEASSSSPSPSLTFNNNTFNNLTLPIAQSETPSTFTIVKASAVAIVLFIVAMIYLCKKLSFGSKIADMDNEDNEDYKRNFPRLNPK